MPSRTASVELHDDDWCVMAIRADRTTRGKARAYFTSEYGTDFNSGRLLKTYYRYSQEYADEMAADGIPEPYDGWPMWECRRTDEGAVGYWKYEALDA